MIEFDFAGLHPSYERPVRDVLRGLDVDYPGVLRRVSLFEDMGDESLGCAPTRGEVRLNRYWFCRPVDYLRSSATPDENIVALAGSRGEIQLHGGMEEPTHVLTHEFGHLLQFQVPGWREFVAPHWRQACLDPVHCRPPSGYALAAPDEFWADCFAAMRMGYESQMTGLMRNFLAAALRS